MLRLKEHVHFACISCVHLLNMNRADYEIAKGLLDSETRV